MRKNFSTLFAILIVLMFTSSNFLYSQLDESRIQKELPLLLNSSSASNAGTHFNLTFHPCWEEFGANNAIRIYVASSVATRVTMEIPGRGLVEQKVTIPNDIVAFHLLPTMAQPYARGGGATTRPRPTAIYRGQAVIITSDDPIICYGVTRYQYTSDGYLAMPVTGLGTEYVVASFGDPVNSDETNRGQWLTSYSSIVGIYDNTRVDFRLGGHERTWVPRNGYDQDEALKPGQTMREYLDAGDVWLIPAMGNSADLTGSYVRANKPVGVISGSHCAYIPLQIAACDFIIEHDLPIHTWGNHYHVTPIAERQKNSYISIFARDNNTTVYRDGIPWLSVSQGKGGLIDQGYIQRRISNTNDPLKGYTVSSDPDKPISVTQYNTGMQDDNVPTDPFQMVLTPLEQFQTEIVYGTPGIGDEYGFQKNFLNVVYLAAEHGGIPDDLELGRVINGVVTWQRLNNIDAFPGYPLWTAEREDGRKYYAKQIRLIWGDGVYRFRADEPFAAYAYGGSNWDSYGFPTSVALADLENPDTHEPVIFYTMDCFGNVPSQDLINPRAFIKDTARHHLGEVESNLGLIYLVNRDTYNYLFEIDDYVPGISLQANFSLQVIDRRQPAQARLIATDRRGNVTDTTITYNPTRFAIRPTYHDFGLNNMGGEVKRREYTIQNESAQFPATIGKFFFKSSERDYPVDQYNPNDADDQSAFEFDFSEMRFNEPFGPKEIRNFWVSFDPVAQGVFTDSIGVGDIDDCLFFYQSEVRATVGNPLITVTNVNFGDVVVGTNAQPRTMRITNNGSTELHISEYTGPELAVYTSNELVAFNISNANPLRIPAGGTREFAVNFRPTEVRDYPDRIDFVSNADQSDPNYKPFGLIQGRGIQPGLIANNYDWERRRADLPRYAGLGFINVTAYSNDADVITLRNEGTAPVTISRIEVVLDESVNQNAFVLANGTPLVNVVNDYANRTIEPNGSINIPVYFHPVIEGVHKLVLSYISDAPEPARTVLEGIGIFPEVDTDNISFAEFTVGSPSVTQDVEFHNTNVTITAPQYLDRLTIHDIEIVAGPATFNLAELNNATVGSQVFYIDKASITFPITLDPNSALNGTLEIPVVFHPGYAGTFTASIRTISDAKAEATSVITGSSIVELPRITGDNGDICLGESIVLNGEFRNEGSAPTTITALEISDVQFTINAGLLASLPLTVQPDGVLTIPVTFTPDAPNLTTTADLIARTSSNLTQFQSISATIIGRSKDYPRVSNGAIDKQLIGPDQEFTYTIRIDPSTETMDLANVTRMVVTINYDREFIAAKTFETAIPGWNIVGNPQKSLTKNETTVITLEGAKLTTNAQINVLVVKFKGYLPADRAGEDAGRIYNIEITHNIDTYKGNGTAEEVCVPVDPLTHPTVAYDPVCADDLRVLTVTANEFSLGVVNPNPVGVSGTTISFSIGIPLYAELNIYNSNGEVVRQLTAGNMSAGNYDIHLNVDDLPSGVYFYELNAGHFREVKQLVIQK